MASESADTDIDWTQPGQRDSRHTDTNSEELKAKTDRQTDSLTD